MLKTTLDKHAPLKKRVVTIRSAASWYTDEVTQEKRKHRCLERKWRKTRLVADRQNYLLQCNVVNNLIISLKSSHYSTVINESSSDQNILFKTMNKLLQKSAEKSYPPSSDATSLVSLFADFFVNKIDNINSKLEERNNAMLSGRMVPSEQCTSELILSFQ